jgi:aryl-alcohol dehydrogenase-like predicted oxidoreductase
MQMSDMPTRPFGRTNETISAIGLGGHHLGAAVDERTAIQIVHEAVDGGVTFFDNCWEYHLGKSESWLGKALVGLRNKVFLMTKVCTHGRDKAIAMRMLEESLRRLQTDHLDLWQIHGVSFDNDPDLFARVGGAAEALELAKKQGKVRYVGFTGHKDPEIHLKMLRTNFPFDSVQMPLNPFDGTFRSFEKHVLPQLAARGIAALGMKSFSGHGEAVQKGVFTPDELLGYAMSLPVATTITGIEKLEVLRHHLKFASSFQKMAPGQMETLRQRANAYADGRFELYKTSIKYDNPEARMAHGFPVDEHSVETQESLKALKNTGKPF